MRKSAWKLKIIPYFEKKIKGIKIEYTSEDVEELLEKLYDLYHWYEENKTLLVEIADTYSIAYGIIEDDIRSMHDELSAYLDD